MVTVFLGMTVKDKKWLFLFPDLPTGRKNSPLLFLKTKYSYPTFALLKT